MSCFEVVMSILTAIYVDATIFYAVISYQTLTAIRNREVTMQRNSPNKSLK